MCAQFGAFTRTKLVLLLLRQLSIEEPFYFSLGAGAFIVLVVWMLRGCRASCERPTLHGTLEALTAPARTLGRLVWLPPLRLAAAVRQLMLDIRRQTVDEAQAGYVTGRASAAPIAPAIPAGLRRRRTAEAADPQPAATAAAAAGSPAARGAPASEEPSFLLHYAAPLPASTWELVSRSGPIVERVKLAASLGVQNEFLLSITKPILPLIALVTLGNNFNGVMTSIFIMRFLSGRVPKLGFVVLHVVTVVFGLIHTILRVSPAAEKSGRLMLQVRARAREPIHSQGPIRDIAPPRLTHRSAVGTVAD